MKVIATTTINEPTKSLIKYSELQDWKLIVAGDTKTPQDSFKSIDCLYLSPYYQEISYPVLSNYIGWNCIQRRTFAILEALRLGAEVIALVDDDNYPYDFWGNGLLVGKRIIADCYTPLGNVFDPLVVTENNRLWHRGYPIDSLQERNCVSKKSVEIIPDIQVNLWNGSPDIDAIENICFDSPKVIFKDDIFPYTSNRLNTFNSQNTIIKRNVFKDYFLFPHIGRLDDIFASWCVSAKGYSVVYDKASVYHDRNSHSYIKDLQDEFMGYKFGSITPKRIQNEPDLFLSDTLPERSRLAFEEYRRIIVDYV